MKKLILSLLATTIIVSAGIIFAKKIRYKYFSGNASWITITNLKKPDVEYYFDIDMDGNVIYRFESKKIIFTKKLKVERSAAKDFFREAKIAKTLISETDTQKKLLFYRGEILAISLYIEGTLRQIKSPLVNFGEAFLYAFNQIKRAVKKAKIDKDTIGFLVASPLSEESLLRFYKEAGKNYKFTLIETAQLKKCKKILSAIKQPYRLIPLKTREEIKMIEDFIRKYKIYGLKSRFYIHSTRGKFECRIVPARMKARTKKRK